MKLVKLDNGRFKATERGISIEGNWISVAGALCGSLDFDGEELDAALEEMNCKRHDTAFFGLNGNFLFTVSSHARESMIAELNAIKQARQLFTEEYKRDPQSAQTRTEADRLQALYISLNVDSIILALTEPEKMAA